MYCSYMECHKGIGLKKGVIQKIIDDYIEALVGYLEYKFNCMIMDIPEFLTDAYNPYSDDSACIDMARCEWEDLQGRKVSAALDILARHESEDWLVDNFECVDDKLMRKFFKLSYPFYSENRTIDRDMHDTLMSGLTILSYKYNSAKALLGYIRNTFYTLKDTKHLDNSFYYCDDDIVVENADNTKDTASDFLDSNSYIVYNDCGEGPKGFVVLRSNIIEYKGYIYYVDNTSNGKSQIVRRKPDSRYKKETILYDFKNDSFSAVLMYSTTISIVDDVLYVGDGNQIIAINPIEGGIICEYNIAEEMSVIVGLCIALGGKVLYTLGKSTSLYMFDLLTLKSTEYTDVRARDIVGYTANGWLNVKNELLVQVNTGEKINVKEKFGFGDGQIKYIDIDRKIVYYYKEDDLYYLRSKIIGVDFDGKIVDEWRVPRIQSELYQMFFKGKENYYSSDYRLTFNGKKIIATLNACEQWAFPQCVMEYDRNGNICNFTNASKNEEVKLWFDPLFVMTEPNYLLCKKEELIEFDDILEYVEEASKY